MIQIIADEKIILDAGHNENDPGAVHNGVTEYEVMRHFREKLSARLTKRGHSHISDKDYETNRVFQNRIRPLLRTGDITLAFHLNSSLSGKASGVETFISKNAGADSKSAATEIVDGLADIMKIPNRGVKVENESQHSSIGILNLRGSAVLIEFGFIQTDLKIFIEREEQILDLIEKIAIKYDRNK
ncbi:N-acetylmuramoyl-L-alanine amidase [Empedobacter falsenii]